MSMVDTVRTNEAGAPAEGGPARRVLLVDEHPLFRAGLAAAIGTEAAFTVVAQASTAEEAFTEARRTRPHIVVTGLAAPGLAGIEVTRALLSEHPPSLRVLVMATCEDSDSLLAAVRAGARGYLLKDASREETIRALHIVAQGGAVFSPRMVPGITTLLGAHDTRVRQVFPALTTREREVLDLLARGLTYPQIARRLVVADKTVRNHAGSIFAKLQVRGRAEAIVRARDAGLGHDLPHGGLPTRDGSPPR